MISDLRQSLDRLDRDAHQKKFDAEKVSSIRFSIFREFVNRERERIRYEHNAGNSGRNIVQQWTAVVDALITEAYRMVLLDNEGFAGECAILALGGYGRNALNVESDVDIMFLFDRTVPEDSPVVQGVLRLLWDLDFELGHSVRTVDQAIEFAETDDISQTAMVDSRFLAGYERLYTRFWDAFQDRFMSQRGREFAELKVEQMLQRRVAHGVYAQVLEPNIKESTGGLRDVHTMQWIMKAKRGTSSLQALVEHRLISKRDFRSLEDAVDLLWRVRNELHFRHNRKHDRIDFDAQPKLAEAFGFGDTSTHLGVEEFMRSYYLAAREIVRVTDSVAHQLAGRRSKTARVTDIVRRRVMKDGIIFVRGKILLPQARRDFFKDTPRRLLSIFADMQRHRAILSETASRAIYNDIGLVDDEYRHNSKNAKLFLAIMGTPQHLDDVLRRMHWTGLLGAYLPEFDRLTCLVQHDYYHAYTADEHSIVCVQRMISLADRSDTSQVAQVYRKIPNKTLAHMSALLHDVGKSGGSGHAERGAEMSEEITERLNMSRHEQDLLAFLIAHHLLLSHISQRRDLDDAAMISSVASHFNDLTSLDLLYVLTWSDMNATQAERPSQWKMQLLDTLHTRLREEIVGRDAEPSSDAASRVLESPAKYRDQLAERIGDERSDRHMTGMPRRYSLIYTLDEAERQALRSEELESEGAVLIDVESLDQGARVIVYTYDRSFLLSDICGVLTVNDLNILTADAYTRDDGVIVDIFTVDGLKDTEDGQSRQVSKLRETFNQVWSGAAVVADLIEKHRRRWARVKPKSTGGAPHVVFDDQISEHYTVMDVFTGDRIGLLYDVSRTISAQKLDIHMARIGTDGDHVADAFYLAREDGVKLVDSEQSELLRTELLNVLKND
jgi:[protein-PII] uridylyltransferase